MNSKALVFVLFAAWSGLCSWWYVCGIKKACGQQDVGGPVITTPAIEPETMPSATNEQATNSAGNGGQSSNLPPAASGNTAIDERGIDKVQLTDLADRVVINFPYGSSRKVEDAAMDDYLSRLAVYLKNSGATVTITGHTDFVGEAKANITMGLQRANSIRDILIKKGVNQSQIKCKSFGENKPVATNDSALGRYKNRRVEIQINQ